jgi:hypothetical protein
MAVAHPEGATVKRESIIELFGLAVVPGLFQTERYVRAILAIGRSPHVERDVVARLDRQGQTRLEPPHVRIILDQTVLEWPIGGPEVIREQIVQLIEWGEKPHIAVRVVPKSVGSYRGLAWAFHLMSPGGRTVAYVEHLEAADWSRVTKSKTSLSSGMTSVLRLQHCAGRSEFVLMLAACSIRESTSTRAGICPLVSPVPDSPS